MITSFCCGHWSCVIEVQLFTGAFPASNYGICAVYCSVAGTCLLHIT